MHLQKSLHLVPAATGPPALSAELCPLPCPFSCLSLPKILPKMSLMMTPLYARTVPRTVLSVVVVSRVLVSGRVLENNSIQYMDATGKPDPPNCRLPRLLPQHTTTSVHTATVYAQLACSEPILVPSARENLGGWHCILGF
jgi:hypothetical protein